MMRYAPRIVLGHDSSPYKDTPILLGYMSPSSRILRPFTQTIASTDFRSKKNTGICSSCQPMLSVMRLRMSEHYPLHRVSGATTCHFLALSRLRDPNLHLLNKPTTWSGSPEEATTEISKFCLSERSSPSYAWTGFPLFLESAATARFYVLSP